MRPSLTEEPLYYPDITPNYKDGHRRRPALPAEPTANSFFDQDHPPESYIPGPPSETSSYDEPGRQFNRFLRAINRSWAHKM